MRRLLLAGILATFVAAPAVTQVVQPPQGGPPSIETGTVPLTYTGGDSRVSVGVDQDGNSQGEFMQVFGNNGEHAVVAQLWWGNGGAGGIQGDYNWLFGTTLEQARQDPDSITVAKLSFAIDQNAEKDRQANIGLSIERREFFLNFFLSGKASGARNAGAISTQQQQVVSGTDDAGIYTQAKTDIATTELLAQPYSAIVGIHGGHFSDALAARFNGGVDYAKGNQGANQKRVSIGVDKYLGVRGWSLSGVAEYAQNTPVAGNETSDTRWWLFLRYEFGGGGAFRPFEDSAAANAAWIDRALHEPVTGHARNIDTYVTKGKTTTTTTLGPKQYSARVPIARDDTVSVAENSSATTIDVLGNDTDPDNNVLAIGSAGPAGHGSVQVSAGKVLYTPTAGYSGADAFPYTITNSKGLSASATVHITVTAGSPPPNSGAPVARDDTTTTPYAQPVTVAVLGNDTDPNGYPLTVTAATTPAHGSSRVNGDGTITYTPNATFAGSDRFAYSIDNAHGGTASANVTIIVQPPALPLARDDSATTAYENPVDIDVLANDTDPAGYPLTVSSVTSPSNGTTTILTNGAVRYRPSIGFSGNDTFSYTVSDGHGGIAGANVSVTVLPQSGTFRARNDSATTAYATPVTIDVLANDSAPTGAKLTIKNVTTPQHGTAASSPAGVIYTPSAAFYGGTDTFDYTVGDGLDTLTATVTVKVLPPGNPVAQDDKATTGVATPVVVTVLANDSDPNHFALTVTSIPTPPAHGVAQINGDNTITYTPTPTLFRRRSVLVHDYEWPRRHGKREGHSLSRGVATTRGPERQRDDAIPKAGHDRRARQRQRSERPCAFGYTDDGSKQRDCGDQHKQYDHVHASSRIRGRRDVQLHDQQQPRRHDKRNGHGDDTAAATARGAERQRDDAVPHTGDDHRARQRQRPERTAAFGHTSDRSDQRERDRDDQHKQYDYVRARHRVRRHCDVQLHDPQHLRRHGHSHGHCERPRPCATDRRTRFCNHGVQYAGDDQRVGKRQRSELAAAVDPATGIPAARFRRNQRGQHDHVHAESRVSGRGPVHLRVAELPGRHRQRQCYGHGPGSLTAVAVNEKTTPMRK